MPDRDDRLLDDKELEGVDEEDEEERLRQRFPDLPPVPDLPPAPAFEAKLPPKPSEERRALAGSGYGKAALAATAASSFILPPIGLGVIGWMLDQRFGTNWMAAVGMLLGLVAGISGLMQVMNRLNDDPPKRG